MKSERGDRFINLLIMEYTESAKGSRLAAAMAEHHRDTYYVSNGSADIENGRDRLTQEIAGHLADAYRYTEVLRIMRGGKHGKIDIRPTTMSSGMQGKINCTTIM